MSTDQNAEFTVADWSEEDTRNARTIWDEYQGSHDLSDRQGEIAGIDPKSGEVWLGKWITDIVRERKDKGMSSPLWFERIGFDTAIRKGGRR